MAIEINKTFTIRVFKHDENYLIEATVSKQLQTDPQPINWDLPDDLAQIVSRLQNEPERVTPAQLKALGQFLYNTLFQGEVASHYDNQKSKMRGENRIRIRLLIEPDELAQLPWELMYDGRDFVALQATIPIVRSVRAAQITKSTTISKKLKILYAWSDPRDLQQLELEATANSLKDMLADNRKIQFDVLPNATLNKLRTELDKDYHILCFAGHGEEDAIYLEDGEIHQKVSAITLSRELEGKPTKLVFLAACKTARIEKTDLPSFAQKLAEIAEVPTVVAMQYEVFDEEANQLTERYFQTLAAYRPIDVALAESRKAIMQEEKTVRDVFAPILYLQTETSHLFRPARNWLAIGFATAFIIAVFIGVATLVFAQESQREAQLQSEISLSRKLSVQAIDQFEDNPRLALLLAVEAFNQHETLESKQSLFQSVINATYFAPYLIATYRNHTNSVTSVVFSSDDTYIASASADGTIYLMDHGEGEPITLLDTLDLGAFSGVVDIAFSPDNAYLVAGYEDGTVRLWEISTRSITHKIASSANYPVYQVGFSPNGTTFTSRRCIRVESFTCLNQEYQTWDVVTGEVKEVDSFIDDDSLDANRWDSSFQDDGRIILTDSRDGSEFTLTGHQSTVSAIAFDSTEDWIVSGDEQGIVKYWHVKEPEYLWRSLISDDAFNIKLEDDQDIYYVPTLNSTGFLGQLDFDSNSVRIPAQDAELSYIGSTSPDYQWLFLGGRLWNLESGNIAFTFYDPSSDMFSGFASAFSPNSEMVAYTGEGTRIVILNINTGHSISLAGHSDLVTTLAFSPDGNILASGGMDNTIILWDLKKEAVIERLTDHNSSLVQVTFSPDRQKLVSNARDGRVFVWNVSDVDDVRFERTLQSRGFHISGVSFSKDGALLATGGDALQLWSTASWERVADFQSVSGRIIRVGFGKDPSDLNVLYENGTLEVWKIEFDAWVRMACELAIRNFTRSEWVQYMESQDYRTTCDFLPESPVVEPEIEVLEDVVQPLISIQTESEQTMDVAFSSDGKLVISGHDDGVVRIVNVSNGDILETVQIFSDSTVMRVASHPTENVFAACSYDADIVIWHYRNDADFVIENEQFIEGLRSTCMGLAFFPEIQSLVAVGGLDGFVRAWDYNTGDLTEIILTNANTNVYAFALSPDQNLMALGTENGVIEFWDLRTEKSSSIVANDGRITDLVFSEGGSILVSLAVGDRVSFWDTSTGSETGKLPISTDLITTIKFAPNGSLLATGGMKGVIEIWQIDGISKLYSIHEQGATIRRLAFNPNETMVAAATSEGAILLWTFAPTGN